MTFDMFKYHDVNLTFCDSKFLNVNKIKYEIVTVIDVNQADNVNCGVLVLCFIGFFTR